MSLPEMEWLWEQVTVANTFLVLIMFVLLNQFWEIYDMWNMPPGPRFTSIPFVGNFLSFDSGNAVEGRAAIAEHTQSLREKYGRVFTVRLGCWKVVFATSPESVHEVLVKRSADFAGRPPFESFTQQTLGGKNIIFGKYGDAWKLHRKLFMTALRQFLHNADVVEERIKEQVRAVLEHFEKQGGRVFDPGSVITASVARITGSISFGEKFIKSQDFEEVLALNEMGLKNFKDRRLLTLLDSFPALAKYAPVSKKYKSLCDYGYGVIQGQLQQRERTFDPSQPVRDLLGGLLKAKSEASYESSEERAALLSEEYLICTLEDMFAAGYDTTSCALRWAISYLVNYPQYQTELQQHIDSVVGRDRLPSLKDRSSLPLVEAVVSETLRVGNVSDMAIPHYTVRETTLCGYRVPKDTVVITDLESVHFDPKCWDNPKEFNPHRHLDFNGNVIIKQDNLLIFSAGRRMCAGDTLAKTELFLFLSIILHQYSLEPAEEESLPDMEGIRGINHYPKPYKICAIKRQ